MSDFNFSRMLQHFTRTAQPLAEETAVLELEDVRRGAGAESLGEGLAPIAPSTPWYYYAGGAAAVIAVLWLLKGKRGRR
jgi:hypothetical protein